MIISTSKCSGNQVMSEIGKMTTQLKLLVLNESDDSIIISEKKSHLAVALSLNFTLSYYLATASTFASASAGFVFGNNNSRKRVSISFATLGFSLRYLAALALPWPILSPL